MHPIIIGRLETDDILLELLACRYPKLPVIHEGGAIALIFRHYGQISPILLGNLGLYRLSLLVSTFFGGKDFYTPSELNRFVDVKLHEFGILPQEY